MASSQSSETSISLAAIALGIFTAFLWAVWPVASRFSILQNLSSNDIAMLRFWVAGLVLLPYLLRKGLGGLSPWMLVFLGVSSGTAYVFIALNGLNYAPSFYAGMVIPSCTMSFTIIGSWLILHDTPSPRRIVGVAIIICGIAFGGIASSQTIEGTSLAIGLGMFVVAGLCWGSFTVAAQIAGLNALHTTAIVSVVAMLTSMPLYFWFGNPTIHLASVEEIVFQGVFQGLVISIIALYTYTKTIEMLGPARASLFVCFVPAFTAIVAYPILGETPTNRDLLSLLIISAGMILALRSQKGQKS